jgi:ribonuclease-3 family protein
MDYHLLSGADLAFIGDAYYELCIREYVLNNGVTKLWQLHSKSVSYVSRTSQSYIITMLMDELTEEEVGIFKRGRNYDYKDKSSEYVNASGFEAVVGYLYLKKDFERLDYIIKKSINIIENKE